MSSVSLSRGDERVGLQTRSRRTISSRKTRIKKKKQGNDMRQRVRKCFGRSNRQRPHSQSQSHGSSSEKEKGKAGTINDGHGPMHLALCIFDVLQRCQSCNLGKAARAARAARVSRCGCCGGRGNGQPPTTANHSLAGGPHTRC